MNGTPEEALPNSAYLVVRADVDAQALVPAIRQVLASLDPGLPLANVRTMGEVLEDVSSGRRLSAGLINLFMGITLLLTAIGIYGTLSFVLLQRTREIGVRMAVGAQRREIFLLVIKQAGSWLLGGLAIGLALSAACSFVLRSLVYAINPLNASPLLLGAGLVGSAVCVACLTPALRAALTDPLTALRCE